MTGSLIFTILIHGLLISTRRLLFAGRNIPISGEIRFNKLLVLTRKTE